MQKKLIAVAVAALAAGSAFADATFYGRMDTYVAKMNNGTDSGLALVSGGMGQSHIGVKADEDLGGGMKAFLQWEAGLASDEKVDLASTRYVNVGLDTGSVGKIQVGAGFTPFHKNIGAAYAISGGADWSYVNSGNGTAGYRVYNAAMTNAIEYIGTFGPITIDAALKPSEVAADTAITTKKMSNEFTVRFAQGPISITGGQQQTNSRAASTDVKLTTTGLGGSFDAKVVKIMATYMGAKVKGGASDGVKDTLLAVTAVVPVGKGNINAEISKRTDDNGAGTKTSTKGFAVDYTHTLGKRTWAYVGYAKLDNSTDTGAAAYSFALDKSAVSTNEPNFLSAAGKDNSMLFAGMRHTF